METYLSDARTWAQRTFAHCDLGDKRRTARLITYASHQARQPAGSTHEVCCGDDALVEGAYRLLRNEAIHAEDIHRGATAHTFLQCRGLTEVIAIQDSTSLEVPNRLSRGLQSNGSPSGFMVHSGLIVHPQTMLPIGLGYQHVWLREKGQSWRTNRPKDTRRHEEKESYQWEQCSTAIQSGIGQACDVITVADREADQLPYWDYFLSHHQRFVIRAHCNRSVNQTDETLWSFMVRQPLIGEWHVDISQRGEQLATNRKQKHRDARVARRATCTLRVGSVQLCKNPKDQKQTDATIRVNVVYIQETNAPTAIEPIEWMLLTTEPIDSLEHTIAIIRYYEARWMIEDYHKAWKTGCRMDDRPLQCLDHILRLAAVTAHIAVRFLQAKKLPEAQPEHPCDTVLTVDESQCLHVATSKTNEPLPTQPPTIKWAIIAIAKLAGWRDTMRTGSIGWVSIWKGWLILQERVLGWSHAHQGIANKSRTLKNENM